MLFPKPPGVRWEGGSLPPAARAVQGPGKWLKYGEMRYSEPGKQAGDLRGFEYPRSQFFPICSVISFHHSPDEVLGPKDLTFSSQHSFGARTARSSLQETGRKLNTTRIDVLWDPGRPGRAVAVIVMCWAPRAAGLRASPSRRRFLGREIDQLTVSKRTKIS